MDNKQADKYRYWHVNASKMYLLVFTWVDVRTTQVAFLPKLLSSIAPLIAHLLRPFPLHKKYKNRIALSFLPFFLLCLPRQVSDTTIPTRSAQKHLTPHLHCTQGRAQISDINEKRSTRLSFSFKRQLFDKVFGDLLHFMILLEKGILHSISFSSSETWALGKH